MIAPVLEGRMGIAQGIDAIASARTAALLDPEGESLAKALAAIDAQVWNSASRAALFPVAANE